MVTALAALHTGLVDVNERVACDGRSSVHNIVAVLAEVFDLGPSVAAHSVDEALEVFWAAGLLATSQLPPEAFSPEDAPTNVLERLHDP